VVTSALRLMAVHAHPDDESSKGAATIAMYVAEGVEVMVVTCTGGERGDVLNAAAQAAVDERGLLAVRREEMAAAAAVLGVQHAWLGFEDSGFPEGDPLPPLPAASGPHPDPRDDDGGHRRRRRSRRGSRVWAAGRGRS